MMASNGNGYLSRSETSRSASITSSSDGSDYTKSTSLTEDSHHLAVKPHEAWSPFSDDPRDSASTYASTIPSIDDLPVEPQYKVVRERHEMFPSHAMPSNPSTFAELFPSPRRLLVRHDDATTDGNMNLRVDTLVPHKDGHQQPVILFHLRMHDLYMRKFSFRRYYRDSGREVCHSIRQSTSVKVPVLRKSLSSVFSNLRPGSSGGTSSSLRRQDSGYKSIIDEDGIESPIGGNEELKGPASPNSISLEFSNYAHVEVRRRRAPPAKRYEFEYWSTKYQWRRESRKDGDFRGASFHLINMDTSKSVAHIVSDVLTPVEAVEEKSKGGWVPPSSLWISDPAIYEKMHDIADVVVATGLIALVDDSIRRRWHNKRHVLLTLPKTSAFMKSVDAVGPKKLIDEMFHRRGSVGSRHSTPYP